MLVTVQDGRAVKLRAIADHPFTRRLSLPEGDALPRTRLSSGSARSIRMMRIGPKGSGQFRRISLGRGDRHASPRRFATIAASPRRAAGDPALQLRRHDGQAARVEPRSAVLPSARRVAARSHHLRHGGGGGLRHHARHAGGHRSRDGHPVALHHQLGLEHQRHQHAPVDDHAPGAQGRRDDRHHRSRTRARRPRRATGGCRSAPAPTPPSPSA